MLEPDVPEYLVDNALIGDERDDPHCPAAAGTKERILPPDLPDERIESILFGRDGLTREEIETIDAAGIFFQNALLRACQLIGGFDGVVQLIPKRFKGSPESGAGAFRVCAERFILQIGNIVS